VSDLPGTPDELPDRTSGPAVPAERDHLADGPAADQEWQPTGLDLAKAVAGEIAGRAHRRRRRPPTADGIETPDGSRAARAGGFTGSGPDERDPQGVGATVERLVDERGWRGDLRLAAAVARWPVVVGDQVAGHTTAERFAEGVLYVQADSTSWATQVRMMAHVIVARLAADIGDGVVTRIVVQGPSAPSWRHGGRRVKGRGPRDTYG
jgi:predicted nucleic acid-binding Zn ribbon protein